MKRWFLAGLWLILIGGVIACADLGGLRGFLRWINSLPFGDKAGHVFLIGTMAHLLNRALFNRIVKIGPVRCQLGGLIVAILMTIEEFTQIWIPSRTFDWGDLAANYSGILAAEWLARRAMTRKSLMTASSVQSKQR